MFVFPFTPFSIPFLLPTRFNVSSDFPSSFTRLGRRRRPRRSSVRACCWFDRFGCWNGLCSQAGEGCQSFRSFSRSRSIPSFLSSLTFCLILALLERRSTLPTTLMICRSELFFSSLSLSNASRKRRGRPKLTRPSLCVGLGAEFLRSGRMESCLLPLIRRIRRM